MSKFKMNFEGKPSKGRKNQKSLITWTPVEDNPELNALERDTVLFGDAIEALHLVLPAFLYNDAKGLNYAKTEGLDYFYVLAKLKKSRYMVLLGEQKKSSQMAKFLKDNPKIKEDEIHYLDLYFAPNFGMLKPQNFLFEQKEFEQLPNTMVLFTEKKDAKKEFIEEIKIA